LHYGRH